MVVKSVLSETLFRFLKGYDAAQNQKNKIYNFKHIRNKDLVLLSTKTNKQT